MAKTVNSSNLLSYIVYEVLNSTVGMLSRETFEVVLYCDKKAQFELHDIIATFVSSEDYDLSSLSNEITEGVAIINGIKFRIKPCNISDNHDRMMITVNKVIIRTLISSPYKWTIVKNNNKYINKK